MTHRRSLDGLGQDRVRGKAQRPDVTGNVRHSQRALKVSEVFEQPRPVGPFPYLAVLVRSEAGRDEVLGLPRVADGRDHTIAGAGQHAGALHDLGQDGVEVEACADAQAGRCQFGDAVPQHLDLLHQFVATLQFPTLLGLRNQTRSQAAKPSSTEEPGSRRAELHRRQRHHPGQ